MITEEKWPIQQPQVSPSPHHPHPAMSPTQMNGMPTDNYIPPYPYDGQAAQGQMHPQPIPVDDTYANMLVSQKQGFVTVPQNNRQTSFQRCFVSMPRQNGSPGGNANSTTNPAVDRKAIDNRPAFTTTSFHATSFPQSTAIRKRRPDAIGFQDAGPFFSVTHQHYNIHSMDRSISYKLQINSKVDRGFFLADNDWTCYRRNYFQISSAFSFVTSHPLNESDVPCLVEVDGQFHPVTGFLLGITARVSNSDKKIELVQHTPKRDKGPQMVPVPKPIRAGGNLNLSSVGSNSNIVTFERIQFKTATANNGKRRAAQQYYVVIVDLYAQVESGEQYQVASSTSAPLVVRGRSPGHYADNHENRYNPMAMNPAYPNDRHISFSHPQGPNGAVMPQDFSSAPFQGSYGQYPPFPNFPGNLMMAGGSNGQAPPFHPQHPHQQYMVPSISDPGDQQNPEMYNDTGMVNGSHDQKMHPNHGQMEMHMDGVTNTSSPHSAFSNFEPRPGANSNSTTGNKPYMKIEIPQSSGIPEHPLTSPAYHSQEYVDGIHLYHNGGHSANNASTHHGGYHSDNEQHHSNGLNNHVNGRPLRPDGASENGQHHSNGVEKSEHGGSKSPPSINSNTTTPTTELGKGLSQLSFRMNNKIEAEDKL
ncbi:18131_t:CDS:2 [Acaulospora morrowiae]|uniref:18131_t:CDS:1 n=1 Tax=Acaulospora morrowiae TaxID=94023 RepID=A0A9N8ZQP0_9GLOM|nr:18131_t:CDS:2 [Acaulospora morrowiae]